MVFKSCGGILELQREIQTSSCVGPMKTNLPFAHSGFPPTFLGSRRRSLPRHLGLFFVSLESRGKKPSQVTLPDQVHRPGHTGLLLFPFWCLTLCDPMDCSPPGSSIHGIFQARILEWVAISFSRGSSQPRDRTQVLRIAGRRFNL